MLRTHRNLAVAVALAAGTMLAACGDDDVASNTTTTAAANGETPSETTGGSVSGSSDAAAFCDPYIETTIMMSGAPDPEALSVNIEQVDANAPAEIAESAHVMTDAVRQVLESQGEDFSAMESPAFAAAQGEVDPFVFENCEFDTTVEVAGVDFGFTGLPETIQSGRVAMLFTNDGAEAHEIAVMRRNDGVTESFEELLSLPEEEAMAKVTPVGGAFAATTGSQALLLGDFEPGDYIAICFVPTGTSVTEGSMTEGHGAPHFMHGMQQEFTVS